MTVNDDTESQDNQRNMKIIYKNMHLQQST